MKACIIQPPYSSNPSDADAFFDFKIQMLDRCDETVDLIVLPEYSDVPYAAASREETFACHARYFAPLLTKCKQTARRCHALVFFNALYEVEGRYRNTTYVLNQNGEQIGTYFKRHLPPFEREVLELDAAYTEQPSAPYVLEIDGVRYGFLTCYDFYFYEAFANLAREHVDILIGCSLQRSDRHDAIETMCKFLAYQTNAYVIRSSVSFREDADICGASMIVSPCGEVLVNMKGRFGMETAEFSPADKYWKPAGFGRPDAPHYEYLEYGRNPWQYRPAGSAMIPSEQRLGYPRLCAHRGFSTVAPENSMPAYGAAVALGAKEIELDIWPTADGEIVSCHDHRLERVSTGTGLVTEKTLAELLTYDFGLPFNERFRGLHLPTFEEILSRFACQTILNVHVKPLSYTDPYPEDLVQKIVALIRKYRCEHHVYLMLVTDWQIQQFRQAAPEIAICVGHLADRPWDIVDRAIQFGCEKVQLFKPYFNQEMIDLAHRHNIRCNVFWSDDPEEARQFLDMGIDTILTNDYLRIARSVSLS